MSLTRICFLLACVCSLNGCAYSIHSLATKGLLVDTPDLTGTWTLVSPKGGAGIETVTFEKAGADIRGIYWVEMAREGQQESLGWGAELLKLGDDLYLQVSPTNENLDGMQKEFNLPLNRVFRIAMNEDDLTIAMCNDQELIKAIQGEGLGMFQFHPEKFVITASSQELQQLYRKHGDKFFSNSRRYRFRKKQSADDTQ